MGGGVGVNSGEMVTGEKNLLVVRAPRAKRVGMRL